MHYSPFEPPDFLRLSIIVMDLGRMLAAVAQQMSTLKVQRVDAAT